MPTIGIIGAGKMGSALYHGLIKVQGNDHNLWLCDHHREHIDYLHASHGCTDPNELFSSVDIVLLAVKPQSFAALAESISVDTSEKMILSIMAGISLENLQRKIKTPFVVRSMPNIGAQIGQSCTAWIAGAAIDTMQKEHIRAILSGRGKEMELEKEEQIDMFTALAGSGPAYFFHLCALMTKKAEAMGFTPEQAELLCSQTFTASAMLLLTGERTADEWIATVASKGGTTEAALKVMNEDGLDAIIVKAIDAAYNRSKSLSL